MGQISSVRKTPCVPASAATDRVIEQSLGGTNSDERRRQALKIGKENRNARIHPLDPSRYVSGGQFIKVGPINERIDGIPG
jgi:hypothetical protein